MNSTQAPKTNDIIQKTADFVQMTLQGAEAGHDWWHIQRVWNHTRLILRSQDTADTFVCELAALLHDIADAKFHDGDEKIGPQIAEDFLKQEGVDTKTVQHVVKIIQHMSFKSSLDGVTFRSLEMDIVQDADRLDAIGALGIARAFHYGGYKNREIYNPEIPADDHLSKQTYQNSTAPTINHFYEKLLRLKDLMNTETAKNIAEQRHAFMETFLQQFYAEWDGQHGV